MYVSTYSQDGYFFNITVKSLGKFFKKDFYVVIYICRYILKAKKMFFLYLNTNLKNNSLFSFSKSIEKEHVENSAKTNARLISKQRILLFKAFYLFL